MPDVQRIDRRIHAAYIGLPMRSFLAGLVIVALISSAALAQVRGEVESIGFGNGFYRPECWTPMIVRLDSQIDETAEYRIEVHQRDLDFDHVTYVKEGITLNGHATQRWEVLFLPEPTNGGLPDNSQPQLQDRLRVFLTNKDGTRQLLQLPITTTLQTLELPGAGFNDVKGKKLILYVAEGGSRPAWAEYLGALGLIEEPVPVRIAPRDLPQSALAYQAVDTLIWVNGDARVLSEQGSTQLAALQQWIRQGGMLVVCQPANDGERENIAPLADMLPIVWKENGQWKVSIQPKDDLKPLVDIATWRDQWQDTPDRRIWAIKGPFPFARAVAKPDAVVDQFIDWNGDGKDVTPYIARIPYGLGSVTWVAQDLGNPAITGPRSACWPYLWDKVFGWRSDTHIASDAQKQDHDNYDRDPMTTPIDLGYAQLRGVEFAAKGAGLIILAIVFFIVYWVIAGPGTYLFLVGRKRPEMSWTGFGAAALAATFLTVLVVRLVLRGSPEIHHATDIRAAMGQQPQPVVALSRIGLYIPRDGMQHVALDDTSGQFASFLTPMAISPTYVPDNEFPANLDYQVPLREAASNAGVAIDIPFRSTLKKLQARWCGDLGIRVRGTALRLTGNGTDPIHGTLDNLTGIDLRNVYIAFHIPGTETDDVLYLPFWSGVAGKNQIDLAYEYPKSDNVPLGGNSNGSLQGVTPDEQKPCHGNINLQWSYYWVGKLRGIERADDLNSPVPTTFPVLSLFDRVPPAKNEGTKQGTLTLLRRGARNLNMSPALESGQLVVLAQAGNRPLPFPLEVNGDRVGGEGTVFYQFALPLDHGPQAPPATAPAQ